MSLSKFSDIEQLSNSELVETFFTVEKELFNLKFQKATRQPFKSHKFKTTRRKIAQIKTLLTLRLEISEKKISK
jgi:large subunit ribosomal protein L29